MGRHRALALATTLALAVMAFACPAAADWRRAESERFIVYSEGGETALRRFVQKLETYDYILRLRLGLPTEAPARKFPIYLLRSQSQLRQVYVGAPDYIAGVYFPREEDIFAIALAEGGDEVLFHEYFHHLSHQTGGLAAYPGWLVEGIAEYYMTADVREGEVKIGGYSEGRAYALTGIREWIPLQTLLTQRPQEITRSTHRDTYYPVAWLLTHWFMNDAARRPQLAAYVRDVGEGGDPVEAMERATGMTLGQLERELRGYMRDSITITRYNFERAPAEVTITTLPDATGDLLLIGQRLKVGVPDEQREATAAEVRRLAARHVDDPFVLLQLAHAELHFGDEAKGEELLGWLVERDTVSVEALQLLAGRRIQQARDEENHEASLTRVRQARAYLARAYALDPQNYFTLQLLAESRQWSGSYPNENDLVTWDQAFQLAPQLVGIRFGYAAALMQAGENDTAIALLEPLANAPHDLGAAQAAQAMIDRARAGDAPLDQKTLDAVADAPPELPPEEPEPEAQP